MAQALLSLEEVLEQAHQIGLEVSERTFRYYAVLGLLPSPVKRPEGDARVHYYPPEILDRLRQIRHLQAQGHSLKQVKKLLLEASSGDKQSPLLKALSEGQWTQACQRFLHGPGSRSSAQGLVLELLNLAGQSVEGLSSRELEPCLRHLGQWHQAQGRHRPNFSAAAVARNPALEILLERTQSVDSEGLPVLARAQSRMVETLRNLSAGRHLEECGQALQDLDRLLSGYLGLLRP